MKFIKWYSIYNIGQHFRKLKTPGSYLDNNVFRRHLNLSVEGNIGCGKTTFLQHFKQFPGVQISEEPIDLWRNFKGHNLLNLMYKDPKRWSLTFQTYVQLTMVKAHTKKVTSPLCLIERSIYSARYCFVENLYQEGLMPQCEYDVLDEWFKWVIQNLDIKVDLIIYLRTSPEVVFERVVKRKRDEEKIVSLDYIKKLHALHENWLYHKSTFSLPAPVITINGNLNLEEMETEYNKCKNATQLYLNKLPI